MKVAIIGGGLSGLLSAKILSERNFNVVVLEKERNLGGLARSFEIENYKIPVFYHHVFSHDTQSLKVLKDLNIMNPFFLKTI